MARELPNLTEDLIRGVMMSGKHASYRNHWSFGVMMSLVSDAPEIAWPILLEVINRAPDEMLTYVAAGPLEDLVGYHGPQLIDVIEREAKRSPRFRKTLAGVWRGLTTSSVWDRLQAPIDDDTRAEFEATDMKLFDRRVEWKVEGRPPTLIGSIDPDQVERRTRLLASLHEVVPDDFKPFDTPVYLHLRIEAGPSGDAGFSVAAVQAAVAETLSLDRPAGLASSELDGVGSHLAAVLVRESAAFDVFSHEPSYVVAVSRMSEDQVAVISNASAFDVDDVDAPTTPEELGTRFVQEWRDSGVEITPEIREFLRNRGIELPTE